jgi:hypothetical protein
MAENYIHNRHSNTNNAADVPELASIVIKDGVAKIGDGVNPISALGVVGDVKRFDVTVTDFTTLFDDITPAIEDTQYWLFHKMVAVTKGGDTPWTSLTDVSNIKVAYNVNGSYGSRIAAAALGNYGTFVIAAAEDEVHASYEPAATDGTPTDLSTVLGKPLSLYFSNNGSVASTTKTNGGTGYVANEVITMTSGAVVTVLTVTGGVVTTYSVAAGTQIALGADTQDSTDGIGTGFAMTIDTVTRFSGGTGTFKVSVWASLETL